MIIKHTNQASSCVALGNQAGSSTQNYGATAIGTNEVLDAGYVAASNAAKESLTSVANPSSAKKNYIVQNYTSTDSEIYAIIVTNLGANATDVGVSMQWREIY